MQYIENELNLNISFAKKEIVVEEPTAEDRSFLDLDGFIILSSLKTMYI